MSTVSLDWFQFEKVQIQMQIINQIGHIQHWGLSPAVNLLSHTQSQPERPLRVLLSGCSDIRHILKTLCDISMSNKQFKQIEFYFHETKVELLARLLLFVHVLHQTHLNYEQRTQLFLDLFGNAMIKQRNARYLHQLRQDLLNFIHSEDKVISPIKKLVNLKHMKFEERDQMSEFVQSWSIKVDFDMEKLRDQKLRYLFKERYDYKANLIDWDYNANLIQVAPIVHFYYYKEWRLSGLAFEQRFSTYAQPNRTLASYAEGRRKQSRTTCLVRGYWGDIVLSPYISFGVRCDYPQKDLLFKKANYKPIGHCVEISIYNMMFWLKRLEEDKEYVRVFRDYYRADEKTQKQLEQKSQAKKKLKEQQKKQLSEIKQSEEEQTQHQPKETQQKKEKQQPTQQSENKTEQKATKKTKSNNDELDSDQQRQKNQVQAKNAKQIQLSNGQLPLLKGFEKYNVQIYPLAMSPETLLTKSNKFLEFFDVIALGFIHSAYLKKQRNINKLLKKGGHLFVERSTFLIPKKPEERTQLDKKLKELAQQYPDLQLVAQPQQNFVFKKKNQ